LGYIQFNGLAARLGLGTLWAGRRRQIGEGVVDVDASTRAKASPFEFHAFASYSRDADFELVRYVHRFLKRMPRFRLPDGGRSYPLELCVDGLSFKRPREANDDWSIIQSYLEKAPRLLVFCSAQSSRSTWVQRELQWFVDNHPQNPGDEFPEAIWPAAVTQDPNGEVFSDLMRRQRLDTNFYNLTFFDPPRPWYRWRPSTPATWLRRKRLQTELARIAADLYGCEPERVTKALLRRWFAYSVLALALLVCLGFAGHGAWARWRSADLANKAESEKDALGSVVLAYDAVNSQPLQTAQNALRKSLARTVPMRTLGPSREPIKGVALDSAAQTIVSFGQKTATIWDLTDNARNLPIQAADALRSAAFSADGRHLALASGEHVLLFARRDGGWQRDELPALDECSVDAVAFDPSGKWLASGHRCERARVWDLTDRTCALQVGHRGRVGAVAFSADGELLFTGSEDGDVGVWNRRQGTLVERLRHHRGVIGVQPSPGGSEVFSVDGERAYRWKLQASSSNGNETRAGAPQEGCALVAPAPTIKGRRWNRDKSLRADIIPDGATGVALAGNTTRFVTADPRAVANDDSDADPAAEARLWNALSDASIDITPVERVLIHGESVEAIAINASGNRVVTASKCLDHSHNVCGSWLHLWDATESVKKYVKTPRRVTALRLTGNDGNTVAAGDEWGNVRASSYLRNRPYGLPGQDTTSIDRVTFAADDKLVATVAGGQLHLRARQSDSVRRLADGGVDDALFDPSGELLMAVGSGGAKVWQVKKTTDAPVDLSAKNQTLLWSTDTTAVAAAFLQDDDALVLVGPNALERRDARTGDVLQLRREKKEEQICAAHFSADTHRLLVVRSSNIRAFDVLTLEPVGEAINVATDECREPVAFSDDGQYSATSQAGVISVWDLERARRLQKIDDSGGDPERRSTALALSHENPPKLVAVGRVRDGVGVFSVSSGKVITSPNLSLGEVQHLFFSRDDQYLIYSGDKSRVYLEPRSQFAPFAEARRRAEELVRHAPDEFVDRYRSWPWPF